MRTASSVKPVPKLLDSEEEEDERTIRRPMVRAVLACAYTTRVTRTVEKVDARLIAIARGEIDPEVTLADSLLPPTVPPPASAPPSVIPLTDEDLIEGDEGWLGMAVEPDPFPSK